MSTLAACRADNFYRPADYDPKNRVIKFFDLNLEKRNWEKEKRRKT